MLTKIEVIVPHLSAPIYLTIILNTVYLALIWTASFIFEEQPSFLIFQGYLTHAMKSTHLSAISFFLDLQNIVLRMALAFIKYSTSLYRTSSYTTFVRLSVASECYASPA